MLIVLVVAVSLVALAEGLVEGPVEGLDYY